MPTIFKWPAIWCVLGLSLAGFSSALVFGQAPRSQVSQEFVDAFVTTERAKLIDKAQKLKPGDKFDASRELEKLQQKHIKVFGTPLPVTLLAEFDRTARETPALTAEELDRIADPKRGPTELSPELFLASAKVKFLEDIREEGTRFETSKELSKVSERYERYFGQPFPQEMQDAVLRSAANAQTIIAKQRADLAAQVDAVKSESKSLKSSAPSTRKIVNGVSYPPGLPDWFSASDQDHDGQVGLYEWDRSRFDEFTKWDLNGDGLLEPREVLRATGHTVPTAKSSAKGSRPK